MQINKYKMESKTKMDWYSTVRFDMAWYRTWSGVKGWTIFLLGLFICCSGERRGSGWVDRLGRQDRRRHRPAHTPPSPSIRTYRGLVILPKKSSLCQMLSKEFPEISQILHLRHKFNGKSASLSRWRLLHRRRPESWREWSRLPGPPSRPIQTISSTLSLVIFSSYARVFSNIQKGTDWLRNSLV